MAPKRNDSQRQLPDPERLRQEWANASLSADLHRPRRDALHKARRPRLALPADDPSAWEPGRCSGAR